MFKKENSVLKMHKAAEEPSVIVTVNLNSIPTVKDFVNAATSVACNVLLISDIYRVNGKSILGVFSLDLSKDVHCKITGDELEINKFLDLIEKVRKE